MTNSLLFRLLTILCEWKKLESQYKIKVKETEVKYDPAQVQLEQMERTVRNAGQGIALQTKQSKITEMIGDYFL
jgi:hypothetical protein